MKRAACLGLVLVIACSGGAAPPPTKLAPPPQGTPPPPPAAEPAYDPPQPTLRLPTHFAPKGYVARLAIDPAVPTFTGSIEITGNLDRRSAVIWLHGKHLHVHAATATRDTTTVDVAVTPRGDDLLELRPATPLPAGRYTLALTYDGTVLPPSADAGAFVVTYGADRYVVTQFEATSARLVFPCVDEPGVKVPWQVTLDVPKGLVAVSNTPVTKESPLDAGHVRVAFAPTRPLPTYLVAFGVGPFDVVAAGHATSGTPLRMIVPRGQAARASYAASALPRIVDALEAWTDSPFPYPKLDVLARDSGGAMENAGLITIDLGTVLLDPAHPSAIARHELISTLGHETSHQWFGDLVTAAWWDDIWLNESFATFMEDKVEMALEPTWHDADYHVSRRNAAMSADGLANARRIRQPIESEGDIHNAFDSITYPKGGTVLAMFEAHLGPDVFQRGIRAYLRAHADGNATVADVVSALEAESKLTLAPAFASFLEQAGVPELETHVTCTAGAPARATITQHRYLAPAAGVAPIAPARGTGTWLFPLCIAFETATHARGETCGWIDQPSVDLALPDSACPAWVLPDVGAHAYALLALTDAQAIALRDHAWDKLTWPERRGVFESVRIQALDGKAAVSLLMSLVPKLLAGGRYEVGDALGDHYSVGAATGLPSGLEWLLPPALVAPAQARARKLIGPLAKRLGLAPRPGESLEDELARIDVVGAEAWAADPAVARDAVALVPHYRDLPPSLRDAVLAIAVTASPAVATRLRGEALAEVDPELRQALFRALGSIRDPARLREMLDVALDPQLHVRDVLAVLTGWSDQPTRAVVEAWLRAHLAEVERAVPTMGSEDFPPLLRLTWVFAYACDASTRDAQAAYMTQTFAGMPSGARPTKQAIERMDQCIAHRALVEPSLRAWLSAR